MRILVGMSGGIDSSAAAILLKEQGHDVVGVSFNFYDGSADNDFFDINHKKSIVEATGFAGKIGITHHIVDVKNEFKDIVINYFIKEYLHGRTPFPCIICNNQVKWPYLIAKAEELHCDYIATGHYVNIEKEDEKFYITKGFDEEKDQSFFLWGLGQDILKKVLFPLGKLNKQKARDIVGQIMPEILEKKESTGICFLNNPDYRSFLKSYIDTMSLGIKEGEFINSEGEVIGKHQGYPFYTVGQRRGLGVVSSSPTYVTKIIKETNNVVLGSKEDLYKRKFIVNNYHIINPGDFNNEVTVKIRYRKQNTLAMVEVVDQNILHVRLQEPLDAVAPGQAAVFYKNNRVLGGGFIDG